MSNTIPVLIPTEDTPIDTPLIMPNEGQPSQAARHGGDAYAWLPISKDIIKFLAWYDPVLNTYVSSSSFYSAYVKDGDIWRNTDHFYGEETMGEDMDYTPWELVTSIDAIPFPVVIPNGATGGGGSWKVIQQGQRSVSGDEDGFWYPEDESNYCYYLTDSIFLQREWRYVNDVKWFVVSITTTDWGLFLLRGISHPEDIVILVPILVALVPALFSLFANAVNNTQLTDIRRKRR